MLNIRFGRKQRLCDGVSRRGVLKIGALGFGALTLADLLRMEARAETTRPHKAVINIHMAGGPSHIDLFDLKPEAPVEFRSAFDPIKTNVPGVEICEHFPLLAAMADKFAIVRSLVGMTNNHDNFQTVTGYSPQDKRNIGYRPSIGSVVAKLTEDQASGPTPFVEFRHSQVRYNAGGPGYLGDRYKGYNPDQALGLLRLNAGLTSDRLDNRASLLAALDNIRRDIDGQGQMDALDSYTQRAVDIVTSGATADALDLSKEDPAIVARYGAARDRNNSHILLAARRLIQTGVRAVTMNAPWGNWDNHTGIFGALRHHLPAMDRGLSALLWDLDRLKMHDDVAIVVWGEFGREPRINKDAGRHHWPRAAFAWLAGGGMRTGQVIGATDRTASGVVDNPIHCQQVFATLYHCLGIDAAHTTITDNFGRPQHLLDRKDPIRELI